MGGPGAGLCVYNNARSTSRRIVVEQRCISRASKPSPQKPSQRSPASAANRKTAGPGPHAKMRQPQDKDQHTHEKKARGGRREKKEPLTPSQRKRSEEEIIPARSAPQSAKSKESPRRSPSPKTEAPVREAQAFRAPNPSASKCLHSGKQLKAALHHEQVAKSLLARFRIENAPSLKYAEARERYDRAARAYAAAGKPERCADAYGKCADMSARLSRGATAEAVEYHVRCGELSEANDPDRARDHYAEACDQCCDLGPGPLPRSCDIASFVSVSHAQDDEEGRRSASYS